MREDDVSGFGDSPPKTVKSKRNTEKCAARKDEIDHKIDDGETHKNKQNLGSN